MDKTYYIILGLVALLLLCWLFYRRFSRKNLSFSAEKKSPKVSAVIVVKDNQKLLEYVLIKLQEKQKEIHEIVVLDLGSIDKTMNVAQSLLAKYTGAKVIDISKKIVTQNYFSIVKNYVSNETVLLLDLYKISISNPNVYIPDLFKSIEVIVRDGLPNPEPRIDGSKLLDFDRLERKKNDYVLNEYITETMANIRMRIEFCSKKISSEPDKMEEQVKEMVEYLDKSIKNITLLSRLMGSVKYTEKNLDDNMFNLFKDYSHRHQVAINYEILGSVRELQETVNELVLGITQDLLYTIIHYNLLSGVEVRARYRRKQYQLVFNYDWAGDISKLLSTDSGISYYVFQSIQNRLSLLGGSLRVAVKRGKAKIFVNIPLD